MAGRKGLRVISSDDFFAEYVFNKIVFSQFLIIEYYCFAMRYLILTLVCLVSISVSAQNKKLDPLTPNVVWGDGSIILNNGDELRGLVGFNDSQGIVTFQAGNNSRSFVPRSITTFNLFDESVKRQRVFYSLEFEDEQSVKGFYFFEVLREFKNFAVISKIDPVEVKVRQNNNNTLGPGPTSASTFNTTTTRITQMETVYFIGSDGAIEPYLKVTRQFVDRDFYDREKTKRKIIDDNLLKKYFTEAEINTMQKFSEKNQLTFESKEDLVKILNNVTPR